jgi:hypothetical protein
MGSNGGGYRRFIRTMAAISQGVNSVSPLARGVAGYSEFDPVASNGSEAGRQKNRSIESILEPYVEQKLARELLEAKMPPKLENEK